MPTTRPDPDKLANSTSADLHAGKLVGLKALKDLARFEWFTSLPLDPRNHRRCGTSSERLVRSARPRKISEKITTTGRSIATRNSFTNAA